MGGRDGNGVFGRRAARQGVAPAVALVNPRSKHNVAKVVRSASCFGVRQVWWTGDRVRMGGERRLPREERMKGWRDVEYRHFDRFLDQFDRDVVPVCVELRPDAEPLPGFEHPERALYVFGPEDGHVGSAWAAQCRRFVVIPTRYCLNLATAVTVVLYDRQAKRDPGLTVRDTVRDGRYWTRPSGGGDGDDDDEGALGLLG